MKRISLLIIGLIAGSALLFSNITISSPAANAKWKKGTGYQIKWSSSGASANVSQVSIILIDKGTGKARLIINPTANDGNHPWTVFNNTPTGSYQILIRPVGGSAKYYSSTFNIVNKFKLTVVGKKPLQLLSKEIKVSSPTKTSNWKTKKTYLVRWETGNTQGKQVKVQLYNHNGKKFLKDLGGSSSGTLSWKIPTSVYKWPGYYKIKVSTPDGTRHGFSGKFHISLQTTKKTYKVSGQTTNKYKYRRKKKKSFTVGCPIADDPGPGKMRVGYDSYYHDSTECAMIYRSFVKFNLMAFQGKGLLLKARLKYRKFMGDNCTIRPLILEAPWNGDSNALFKVKAYHHTNPADVTSVVQKWLAYPNSNYGVVFAGTNESLSYGAGKCLGYYEAVELELEFVEKK